jgi:hypothetical protein
MDGDKIEQHVTISDNAQTGPVTLIGKIEYIINIINSLRCGGGYLKFLSGHRTFWVLAGTELAPAIYAHQKPV